MNTTTRSVNLRSSIDALVHETRVSFFKTDAGNGRRYLDSKLATICGARATGTTTLAAATCPACQALVLDASMRDAAEKAWARIEARRAARKAAAR